MALNFSEEIPTEFVENGLAQWLASAALMRMDQLGVSDPLLHEILTTYSWAVQYLIDQAKPEHERIVEDPQVMMQACLWVLMRAGWRY